MMPNNRKYQPQRLQRTTNSLSGHGMLLHDRPLRRCEITAFFQNFIGHSNFPEVMQLTTAPQSDYTKALFAAAFNIEATSAAIVGQ